MEGFLAIALCIAVSTYLFGAADNGYKVMYDGGSIADLKAGTDLKLYLDGSQIRFLKDKKEFMSIPASSITESATVRMSTAG